MMREREAEESLTLCRERARRDEDSQQWVIITVNYYYYIAIIKNVI